jgi:hypothetical protein
MTKTLLAALFSYTLAWGSECQYITWIWLKRCGSSIDWLPLIHWTRTTSRLTPELNPLMTKSLTAAGAGTRPFVFVEQVQPLTPQTV